MPTPQIRETPALSWAAAQTQTVRVSLTPRDGLALTDYGTFTLTVRADPEYPRTGAALAAVDRADPLADGWAVSTSAEGAIDDDVIEFEVTVPSEAGRRRYALDVVAEGGDAGRVQVVEATWLTVLPTLRSPS
jgi:hypothetical protein